MVIVKSETKQKFLADSLYSLNLISGLIVLLIGNLLLFLEIPFYLSILLSLLVFAYTSIIIGRFFTLVFSILKESNIVIPYLIGFTFITGLFLFIAIVRIFVFWTFFAVFNFVIIFYIIHKILHIIYYKKISFTNLGKQIQEKYQIRKNILLISVTSVAIIILLFLFYFSSQIGVDTYRINYLSFALIRDGYLSFGSSFLSMLQLVPYSQFPAPVVLVAGFSLLTKLSIENSILLSNLFLIIFTIFGTWKMFSLFFKIEKAFLLIPTVFYTFSPLLMKFLGYSLTGRSIVFAFLPFSIFLAELMFRQKSKFKIALSIIANLFLCTILLFSHRMFFVYPAFIIVRFIIKIVSKNIKNQKDKFIIYTNLAISIIGIIFLLVPLFLYLIGNNSLILQWFEPYLSDLAIFIPIKKSASNFTNMFIMLNNFTIYSIVRMIFIIPLMIIEFFTFNLKKRKICFSNENHNISFYLTAKFLLVLLFPLIFRSMFVYQSIAIFMVYFSLISLRRIYQFIKNFKQKFLGSVLLKFRNPKREISKKFFSFMSNKKRVLIVSGLIVIFIVPSITLEFQRYDFFKGEEPLADYITSEVRELAEYIHSNFANTMFYTESKELSLQLLALSPNNQYLPIQENVYLEYDLVSGNQKPVFKGWPNSLNSLYEFIFLPFTYPELVAEEEILSISSFNYSSLDDIDSLYSLLLKYNVSYVISIRNLNSDLFFTDLNINGNIVYNTTNFNIIDVRIEI